MDQTNAVPRENNNERDNEKDRASTFFSFQHLFIDRRRRIAYTSYLYIFALSPHTCLSLSLPLSLFLSLSLYIPYNISTIKATMVKNSNNGATTATNSTSIWDTPFMQNTMPDPTRIFSLLVIGIMFLIFLAKNEWDATLLVTGFILNPYVVLFFTMACLAVYDGLKGRQTSTAQQQQPLPVYDRWTVEWYWWNAWLYHMVMDGGSGSFQLVPVVVQQYNMLDQRFPDHHVVPWMIGVIELFVMGPLCLVTLWTILRRHPARYPLEIITSTLHITGMIVFVGAEVYEGQLNVPALDPVGTVEGGAWANVKLLDTYQFIYYWFGFWFCNLIWGFVPLIRIWRALQVCSTAIGAANEAATKSKRQ